MVNILISVFIKLCIYIPIKYQKSQQKININSQYYLLVINTYLNCINSPNSAGKLRNLLLDTSNVRRLTNSPISAGKRNK